MPRTGPTASGAADVTLTVTSGLTVAGDSYATGENGVLNVAAVGVYANDVLDGAPGTTAGATLEYLAWQDTDGNGIWEDETGVAGYDFDFAAATVVRDTAPSNAPAGIGASYVFDGSGGGEFAERFEDLAGQSNQ